MDSTLVETLGKVLSRHASGEDDNFRIWDEHWEKEQCRISSNKMYYGGTAPKNVVTDIDAKNSQIADSRLALEVFKSLDLIVGFHADQATEPSIDLALLLGIPFAVVPCCVFPREFPDRSLNDKKVRTHGQFIEYLCLKDDKIRKDRLPFVETDTAKNVVLYMLDVDFDSRNDIAPKPTASNYGQAGSSKIPSHPPRCACGCIPQILSLFEMAELRKKKAMEKEGRG